MEDFISEEEARRRHAALRKLARHLVASAEDAEDAVQDTWLARLNQVEEPIYNNEGWLRRVLRRKVGLQHRQRSSRAEHERRAARPEAQPPDESLLQSDLSATLQTALHDLREPYQTVLRLRYIEQLSERGICEALNRPLTTVKSQITRGLALLRRGLEGRIDEDRGSWTGALLGLLLGWRSAVRGTAPALTVVASGLIALQVAVAAALNGGAGTGAEFAARPAQTTASESAPDLSPVGSSSEQVALAPVPELLELQTHARETWSEPERPWLEPEQRAPAGVSVAVGGPSPTARRAARQDRRERTQKRTRRLPVSRGDGARPEYFAGGRIEEKPAEARAAGIVRRPKHRRRNKGRSKPGTPPNGEGLPPVSGKVTPGGFGSSTGSAAGSGGGPSGGSPDAAPRKRKQRRVSGQALQDGLRVVARSRR